jgi:hypothetical protein
MATLADYFLDVKSIFDDTPVGNDGFWEIKYKQIEGLRLMLNARNLIGKSADGTSFTPFTPIAAFPDMHPKTLASRINDFRTKATQLLGLSGPNLAYPKYLNYNTHVAGSLENAASITRWTLNAAMTEALGKTTFTRVPSRNPFGYSSSEGSLVAHDIIYREHINEIVELLRVMRYQIRGLENVTANAIVDTAERIGSSGLVASCATAQADASNNWDSASWVGIPVTPAEVKSATDFDGGTTYAATLYNVRHKYSIDLTNYVGVSSSKLYLRTTKGSNSEFGQARPISNAEGLYGEWAAASLSVGGVNTTPYVTNSDVKPIFLGSTAACNYPTAGGVANGWHTEGIAYVFEVPEEFGLV